MVNAAVIAELLTDRYGLELRGEVRSDPTGQRIRLSPVEVAQTQGFSIEVLIGWRTIETNFIPGSFASLLISEMQNAVPQQRAVFRSFIEAAKRDSAQLSFAVNSMSADPMDDGVWGSKWYSVALQIRPPPSVIDHNDEILTQSLVIRWAGRMLGLVLSLLPLEHEAVGEAEGGVVQIVGNRYERSSVNRAACIEIQGDICKVCGFNFGTVYGEIGKGFIEVHHIEPVSGLQQGTVVNPASDLVPLCANCHSMIHRKSPPYTVEELKTMIRTSAHASVKNN